MNSRLQKRLNTVWRRRACESCNALFTTLEQADYATSIMVRHNNVLKPFVRDKLLIDIHEACKHRPDALNDALELTRTITSDVVRQITPEGVIDQSRIVDVAHTVLKRFDSVAATVYMAYHK